MVGLTWKAPATVRRDSFADATLCCPVAVKSIRLRHMPSSRMGVPLAMLQFPVYLEYQPPREAARPASDQGGECAGRSITAETRPPRFQTCDRYLEASTC